MIDEGLIQPVDPEYDFGNPEPLLNADGSPVVRPEDFDAKP